MRIIVAVETMTKPSQQFKVQFCGSGSDAVFTDYRIKREKKLHLKVDFFTFLADFILKRYPVPIFRVLRSGLCLTVKLAHCAVRFPLIIPLR